MDASELVALLKKRDRQGIALLYDTYSAPLYGIIYRIVPSEAQAEALLERTLLTVWESIQAYNARHTSFFTWIATIARTQANESKTTSVKDEIYPVIRRLTEGMDHTSAQVLEYVYFGGISLEEAAVLLKVPVNTVRIKLKSALSHLQASMKPNAEKLLSCSPLVLFLLF